MQGVSLVMSGVAAIPGVRGGLANLTARTVKGSTGGPDADERARTRALIVAQAFDASGVQLSEVRLEGDNMYTFTAAVLAWGAQTTASGGLRGTGALGPVDGFGLEALTAGVAEAGIAVAP
jgi:short subunit dehydrogenase-like uncharacterized protein